MLQLRNRTPFSAAIALMPNVQGIETVYLMVTATFDMWPRWSESEAQPGPPLSDAYHGDPARSSLRIAGEAHLGKAGTDVVVVGHAQAPGGRAVAELKAGVRVGPAQRIVRVVGDRQWRVGRASAPEPFTRMPLVYERAFGGVAERDGKPPLVEARNPVGVGMGIAYHCGRRGDPLPNLEDPRRALAEGQHPEPVGLGCIAPSWLPRRAFAGTYDEAWQTTRAPFLPEDFQPRFFNCGSGALALDRFLQGGEPLSLLGLSERGALRSALPKCQLDTAFMMHGQRHARPNRLQTVLLEPDEGRLRLTFQAEFPCDKAALDVQSADVALSALEFPAPWSRA